MKRWLWRLYWIATVIYFLIALYGRFGGKS